MNNKIIKYSRQPEKGVFVGKVILVVLASSLMLFFFLFWGQARAYHQINKEAEMLEAKREGLRAENEHLKEKIRLLQEDEYIEIQARRQLGLVYPGEIIFYIGD